MYVRNGLRFLEAAVHSDTLGLKTGLDTKWLGQKLAE